MENLPNCPKCNSEYTYEDGSLLVCPECAYEWSPEASNEEEVQGVNDNVELAHANKYMRQVINEKWMRQGVTFVNPDTTYVGPDVTFGHDVTIYPNTYFYGKTTIGDYTVVTPGTYLNNATIGSHCLIDASEITACN